MKEEGDPSEGRGGKKLSLAKIWITSCFWVLFCVCFEQLFFGFCFDSRFFWGVFNRMVDLSGEFKIIAVCILMNVEWFC